MNPYPYPYPQYPVAHPLAPPPQQLAGPLPPMFPTPSASAQFPLPPTGAPFAPPSLPLGFGMPPPTLTPPPALPVSYSIPATLPQPPLFWPPLVPPVAMPPLYSPPVVPPYGALPSAALLQQQMLAAGLLPMHGAAFSPLYSGAQVPPAMLPPVGAAQPLHGVLAPTPHQQIPSTNSSTSATPATKPSPQSNTASNGTRSTHTSAHSTSRTNNTSTATTPSFDREAFCIVLRRLDASATVSAADVDNLLAVSERIDATDADVHRTFLEEQTIGFCRQFLRLCIAIVIDTSKPVEDSVLFHDLVGRRGALTVAAFDVLLFRMANAENATAAESDAALLAQHLQRVIIPNFGALIATQRGCVSVMRLISMTHHIRALVTPLVRAAAKDMEALLAGSHSPYIACHILSGLCAPSSVESHKASDTAALHELGTYPRPPVRDRASTTGGKAWCAERAAYVIEFAPWVALAASSDSEMRHLRSRCEAAVWTQFAESVLQGLVARRDLVLRGRQQCFVLWHTLRSLALWDYHGAALLVRAISATQPNVAWPPSTDGPHDSTTANRLLLHGGITPLAALCRSTAGRCAIVALLPHIVHALKVHDASSLSHEQTDAARSCLDSLKQLFQAGLPPVDKSQERTLKMRPGMEAAATLETRLAALVRTTAG